jgi:hypothetical protein
VTWQVPDRAHDFGATRKASSILPCVAHCQKGVLGDRRLPGFILALASPALEFRKIFRPSLFIFVFFKTLARRTPDSSTRPYLQDPVAKRRTSLLVRDGVLQRLASLILGGFSLALRPLDGDHCHAVHQFHAA